MNENSLKRLLRTGATDVGQPRRRCPGEADLAAYADGRLSEPIRRQLESHLAECEACLGQIEFLLRQPAEACPGQVLPGAVARARDLVAARPSLWRPLVVRWGSAVAGLACVAIVVVAVMRPGTRPQAPNGSSTSQPGPATETQAPSAAGRLSTTPGSVLSEPATSARGESKVKQPDTVYPQTAPGPAAPTTATASRTVRSPASAVRAPTLDSPAEGATFTRKDLAFRWQAVPGSLYYELTLATDDGAIAWHARVEGTSARPPDDATLVAGAKYFVWIRAFLPGGESARSAAVSFHVAKQ